MTVCRVLRALDPPVADCPCAVLAGPRWVVAWLACPLSSAVDRPDSVSAEATAAL